MRWFRRARREPWKWQELATYNAEHARGIVHAPWWVRRMAEQQRLFDAEHVVTGLWPEPTSPDDQTPPPAGWGLCLVCGASFPAGTIQMLRDHYAAEHPGSIPGGEAEQTQP